MAAGMAAVVWRALGSRVRVILIAATCGVWLVNGLIVLTDYVLAPLFGIVP